MRPLCVAVSLVPLACLAACENDSSSSSIRTEAVTTFVSVDSLRTARMIEFGAPESAPLIRVSGVDVSSGGHVAVGDASEGNIKVYNATGDLIRVVGARGSGPGEFRTPIEPQFDSNGTLHVLDITLRRVSRWDGDGHLIGEVALSWMGSIDDFVVMDSNRYVVAGTSSDAADSYTAFLVDSAGDVVRRWLPVRASRPSDAPASPIWNSVRRTVITSIAGGFAAVNTLSDTLWVVRVDTDSTEAVPLPAASRAFTSPPEVGASRLALRAWIESLRYPTQVVALHDGSIAIASAGGPYFQLESTQLWLYRNGSWRRVIAAPPIVGTAGTALIAVESDAMARGKLRLLQDVAQ